MDKLTFEQALKRLEEIVKELENETTPLEESVVLFQEGVELSKICSKKISNIEQRVAKIALDGEIKELIIEE